MFYHKREKLPFPNFYVSGCDHIPELVLVLSSFCSLVLFRGVNIIFLYFIGFELLLATF